MLREGERGSTGLANAARRVLVASRSRSRHRRPLWRRAAGQESHGSDAGQSRTRSAGRADDAGVVAASRHLRPSGARELLRRSLTDAEGFPGIRSIGAISHLPLSGQNAGRGLTIEGRPVPTREDAAIGVLPADLPWLLRDIGDSAARGPRLQRIATSHAARRSRSSTGQMARALLAGREPDRQAAQARIAREQQPLADRGRRHRETCAISGSKSDVPPRAVPALQPVGLAGHDHRRQDRGRSDELAVVAQGASSSESIPTCPWRASARWTTSCRHRSRGGKHRCAC